MENKINVKDCPALCCGSTCLLFFRNIIAQPKYKLFCKENIDCMYRQFERKNKECEELSEELDRTERNYICEIEELENKIHNLQGGRNELK